MKVYELLDSPEKWIKGDNALNKDGIAVDPRDKNAVCWCLAGALQRCYGPKENKKWPDSHREYYQKAYKLKSFLDDRFPQMIFLPIVIIGFNDDPNTTYNDVIRICKELDI